MVYAKYKLEEEAIPIADYRKLKRDKQLNAMVNALNNGWKIRSKEVSLLREQRIVLTEYFNDLIARQRKPLSIVQTMREIMLIAIAIKKPFTQYNEKDLKEYFAELWKENKSQATVSNRMIRIKAFFKWLYASNSTVKKDNKGVPLIVNWMKGNVKGKQIEQSDLITIDEVYKMVEVATNDRDRFIPIALYETGCRVEEFTNIKFKDIMIEGEGDSALIYITVDGKTGKRQVICKNALQYYRNFARDHIYRNKNEAPLFISLDGAKPEQYTTTSVYLLLKRLAKRAGIDKKIYPHLFRHSRATELAQYMTESELRKYFGWVKNSDMPSNYIHINNLSVKNKIKAIYGIKVEEQKQINQDLFKSKICDCGYSNSPTELFYIKCGKNLIKKTEREIKMERVKKVLDFGLNHPETKDRIADLLAEIVDKM